MISSSAFCLLGACDVREVFQEKSSITISARNLYELVLTNITLMGADIGLVSISGKVVGAKLTPNEIGQINKLVETGLYLNPSDFIRDAVREKLAAIKVIQYRDLDYETAKKEVAGYFRMKGEAYASDASTDLELDYELVCRIMDDLEKEGKMEAVQ
jgi:Arc/MetJ-type ribon-helix-helix transcriptional regulator